MDLSYKSKNQNNYMRFESEIKQYFELVSIRELFKINFRSIWLVLLGSYPRRNPLWFWYQPCPPDKQARIALM